MIAPAALLLLALAAAPRVETPVQVATRLAARQFPKARWRPADARQADFTYRRQADVALLGFDETTLMLVVVEGPVSERSAVHALRLRAGLEAPDALCGAPEAVQANTERPDSRLLGGRGGPEVAELIEEGGDAGALGLVLVHTRATGYCEPFHVLYDGAQLAWWRAPQGRP
jgi:hypothetical protein